ncbi:glutamate racemase [Atopobium sp. oral taxon 810]|uniref:glutamate racemase n=1 Tax=Atopobium sp. oral taxon 810 TaxID=712158 RepID=UPI000396545B|nr:glutamate racemase [Atopobium sp. oral taxon 810]ERI06602.1 glutamate racemase [Atopobium sp. oral taxon 810 str. F0209]
MAKDFIGVLDSGVGGISVLRKLVCELPHEDFHFFGDSAHNPYGEKTDEEVRTLTRNIIAQMVENGAKAVVIACNTATSAAADAMRDEYDIPIVGVEPALKPACGALPHGRILVMATPVTLRLDKYQQLKSECYSTAEVIEVPCAGLATRIEKGHLDDADLHALLGSLIGCWADKIDGVVLGCTHYPFVTKQIRDVLGDVRFFDGAAGTARQTRHLLEERGLLYKDNHPGKVQLKSSLDTSEQAKLYRWFFEEAPLD